MHKTIVKFFSIGLIAAAAVFVPVAVSAASTLTGSTDVKLPASETREGTLYAYGESLVIDGAVKGDLVCAGQDVVISGPVSGDIICAAQRLTINSATAGNVRVIGQTVTINGPVGKNLNVIGQTVDIKAAALIGGEVGVWAETVNIDAPVASNVYGAMTTLTLSSTVGGNVDVIVDDLVFGDKAKITGNLGYASASTFNIESSKVGGQVRRSDPPEGTVKDSEPKFDFGGWLFGRTYVWLAILVMGLPLVLVAPRVLRRLTTEMLEKPGQTVGWGFVVHLVWPIIGIIVFCTIIGIPLALMGLVVWIMLFLTAGIFAGIALGKLILQKLKWHENSLIWAWFIGITLFVAVTSLPIIGFLLSLVALWWVTGGLLLGAKYLR